MEAQRDQVPPERKAGLEYLLKKLKERAAEMEKEHKTMLDDWKKGKEDYQTLLSDANNQVLSLAVSGTTVYAPLDKRSHHRSVADLDARSDPSPPPAGAASMARHAAAARIPE